MTLIEVMVSMCVLTVAAYLLSSTLAAAVVHSGEKRERLLASEALGNMIESMHAEAFGHLFANYNLDPGDDPAGAGTAPGAAFAVPGLEAVAGDPDGLPGEISMPSPGPELREDVDLAILGMPRDLNGDLLTDEEDHSQDYFLLPVVVRVRWAGRSGPRELSMTTIFVASLKQ